jgi:superfamily II DNA or RNA helicase
MELAEDHAIIFGGRASDDIYAVLDFPAEGKLSVRHSVSDRLKGRALAVAGLYEIEEFVIDEVAPIAADNKETERPRPPLEKPEEQNPAPRERQGPELTLSLSSSQRGLRLGAYWLDTPSKRVNAVRAQRTREEGREALIALAALARASGFQLRTFSGDYLLRDPQRASSFVRDELPKWHKHFKIECDDSVAALRRGIRRASVTLRVDRDEGSMRTEFEFRLGGSVLSGDWIDGLLRRPGEVVFHPKMGLVGLEHEQARWIEDWKPVLEDRFQGELPFYMLFSLSSEGKVPLMLSDELEEWKSSVTKGASGGARGLPKILRDYQRKGVRWMRHLLEADCHPLLADEMGLGKTLQVLSLLATDPKAASGPSLIVCPASVLPVWEAEAERFFPHLKMRRLHKGNAFDEPDEPVLWLTSYTQLRRHRDRLHEQSFIYCILDEAQVIKNPEAKVTQACCAVRAERRLAVTGTPIENRSLDLWTLFRFLMPGLLGSKASFESKVKTDVAAAQMFLRTQVKPFVLRRTKSEVGKELPPKVEIQLPCPMTEVQVAEYRRLVEEGIGELDESPDAALKARPMPLLSLLTRLRQTCCDPALLPWRDDEVEHSGKLMILGERLDAVVQSGRKAVVFSQFVRLLDRAETMLKDRFGDDLEIYRLTGSTTDRASPVKKFQEDKKAAVILVSLKAGGTGITLHSADYVFLLDPWWNPAVEAQAIDRVHRIGQRRRVMVYRLVTRGTVEERIDALKNQKRDEFEAVLGSMEGAVSWIKQFSRLTDLIAYREEG